MKAAAAAITFCIFSHVAMSGPITYEVGGFSASQFNLLNDLTGSITTDGTIGLIYSSDITAWSFSVSAPNPFTFNSGESGAQWNCLGTNGCFSATATSLSFDFLSNAVDSDANVLTDNYGAAFLNANCGNLCPSILADDRDVNGALFWEYPQDNVIATTASSVPAPATFAIFGLGLAVLGWSKRKKS